MTQGVKRFRMSVSWGAGLFSVALAFLSMVYVFWDVIPKFSALVGPDDPYFFYYAFRTEFFESVLCGTASVTPASLYGLIFSPLYSRELSYVLGSFFLAVAIVYYLRGRNITTLSAWTGGLATALSGYTFTLFSAGHRGEFDCFSMVFFSFGLLIRCFEKKNWFYFAMLGGCLMWAQLYQPDVWVIIVYVLAAYFIWLTFLALKTNKETFSTLVKTIYVRFLFTLIVATLIGLPGVKKVFSEQMKGRDSQIGQFSSPSGPAISGSSETANAGQKKAFERWIFATNWSLPPEDVAEFVVPGVWGDSSMIPPYPYWGRLGRPHDEVFQMGRMMPNYRQHSVYLGVIAVVLAFFGVIAYFSKRKEKELLSLQQNDDFSSTPHCSLLTPNDSDVPFWCGVWIVCLLLAFGRYTPVYRAFYAIPYMDYLRAPVKFLHLTEVATGILAGFGMHRLLSMQNARELRGMLRCVFGLLILLGLMALVALVSQTRIEAHIDALGLGQVKELLAAYMVANTFRSFVLVGVVVCILWVMRNTTGRVRGVYCAFLFVLLVGDLASAAKRYVRAQDVTLYNERNALVQASMAANPTFAPNVMNLAVRNGQADDWLSPSLSTYGIRNMVPTGAEDKEITAWFKRLPSEPQHVLMATRTAFILGAHGLVDPLIRAGLVRLRGSYRLTNQGLKKVDISAPADLALVETPYGKEPVSCYFDWKGNVLGEDQLKSPPDEQSVQTDAPSRSVKNESGTKDAVRNLKVDRWRRQPGCLSSLIHANVSSECLLILNERFDSNLEVFVDGKSTLLYRADGLWTACLLNEGDHNIVVRKKRGGVLGMVSALAGVALVAWALGRALLSV